MPSNKRFGAPQTTYHWKQLHNGGSHNTLQKYEANTQHDKEVPESLGLDPLQPQSVCCSEVESCNRRGRGLSQLNQGGSDCLVSTFWFGCGSGRVAEGQGPGVSPDMGWTRPAQQPQMEQVGALQSAKET